MAAEREEGSTQAKQHLNACLQALQDAKTDTEKFAALLVVAKSVEATECTAYDKKRILDAVGFSFFVRLLRTKEVPGGCSSQVFKSVAVSILSALVDEPFVASDQQMKQIVPHLKEILETVLTKHIDEDKALLGQLVRDTFSIVSRMACVPEGAQMLQDDGYPWVLVQILDNKPDEETFVMTQSLLILLQWQFGAEVWNGTENCFDKYLSFIVHHISHCEDKFVFDMCELTTYVFNYVPKNKRNASIARSVKPLMEKLSRLIRSKLGVKQRQVVLSLVNQLVVHFGVECLLPPMFPDHKIFLLVLSLTCVEVRLAVENFTLDQLQKYVNRLCLHYNSLEIMLSFLCQNDEDQALPLEASAFSTAHDALLSAANGVFYFLQQIAIGTVSIPLLHPLIVASVRMAAAIASQAFTEVRDSVLDVLPFLVKLCQMEVGAEDGDMEATQGGSGVAPTIRGTEQSTQSTTGHGDHTSLPAVTEDTSVSHSLKTLHIGGDSQEHSVETVCAAGACDAQSSDSTGDSQSSDSTGKCSVSSGCGCGTQHKCGHSEVHPSKDVDSATELVNTCGDGVEPPAAASQSQDSHCRQSTGIKEKESCPLPARKDMKEGGEGLPRTFDDLMKWVSSRSDCPSFLFPSVEVIKFLAPVFHFVCEEEESRRVFVEQCGHTALIQFLLQRQPLLMNVSSNAHTQEEGLGCQLLEVLLQLVMGDEELGDTDPFVSLLNNAVTTVPLLDDIPQLYVYKAFLVAVGLNLLQMKHGKYSADHKEQVSKFLQSSVTYICKAAGGLHKTVVEADVIAEHWHDVQDVWVSALENLKLLIPFFPHTLGMFLQLGFIENTTAILTQHPGSILKKETVPGVMDFLESLAFTDKQARKLLKKNGGLKLARAHQKKELEMCLQKNLD